MREATGGYWPIAPADTRCHKAAARLGVFFRMAAYGKPSRTRTVGHLRSLVLAFSPSFARRLCIGLRTSAIYRVQSLVALL